jgi:glycosyltransferase involved in cell wall biosynthesis
MPTYNHEKFVEASINSVLQQQGVDLELLICDDGSTDRTRDVVMSLRDPRIHFEPNTVNRGACVTVNSLIARAKGEFIAHINSDDVWSRPDKLLLQLAEFDAAPQLGACFGRAAFIDANNQPIPAETISFGAAFDQANRSQGQWLHDILYKGNALCHPTILARRTCYEKLGGYDNRLRQLYDMDMWVRLLKAYPIHVCEEVLVNFRILPGENASSPTAVNNIRTMNEHYLLAESFLEGVSASLLKEAFGGLLHFLDFEKPTHVDLARVLPFFHAEGSLHNAYQLMGHLKLNGLLASPAHAAALKQVANIDDLWFQKSLGQHDCLLLNRQNIEDHLRHLHNLHNLQVQQSHESQIALLAAQIQELQTEQRRLMNGKYWIKQYWRKKFGPKASSSA